MRGEKLNEKQNEFLAEGSPPHARGKGDAQSGYIHRLGITPACAGKSTIEAEAPPISEDHPRMRGEKTKRSLSYANSFDPLIKIHSV